jgi:transposase
LDEGKTVGAAARELDLTPSALSNWVRQARADRTKGKTGLTTEERAELSTLRKENRELRMERDILKNLRGARRTILLDQKLRDGVFCAATEGSGRQLFGGSTP